MAGGRGSPSRRRALRSGSRRRFPPDSARGGLRLDALGFYEIAAGTGADTPVTVVAVNPSPEESDLARADQLLAANGHKWRRPTAQDVPKKS